MLTVRIIAVGRLKEAFFRDAAAEYLKRLGAYCKCRVAELPESRLPPEPSPAQISSALKKEGDEILKSLGGGFAVSLCVDGDRYTSVELASLIKKTAIGGVSEISFIIGSSYGLSPDVTVASRVLLSLSDMTLPHQLCRVVLAEQLYRAFSINAGGKYHK